MQFCLSTANSHTTAIPKMKQTRQENMITNKSQSIYMQLIKIIAITAHLWYNYLKEYCQ